MKPRQRLGLIAIVDVYFLLYVCPNRLAIRRRRKSNEIDWVVGRYHYRIVERARLEIRQRERDVHGDVAVRGVQEPIAHPDLVKRNKEILGQHFDVVVPDEDEPPGRELRCAVVRLKREVGRLQNIKTDRIDPKIDPTGAFIASPSMV